MNEIIILTLFQLSYPFYFYFINIIYLFIYFTHLKLSFANATHNFKWVKITNICLIRDQIFTKFMLKFKHSFLLH